MTQRQRQKIKALRLRRRQRIRRAQEKINRRSPRRIRQGAVLAGSVLLFCSMASHVHGMEKPVEISIAENYIKANQPIEVSMRYARQSDVESCVWYVGGREVSRTEGLEPYLPAAEDAENFIRVQVTLKNGTVFEDSRYFSVLPVLYLESGTAYTELTKDSYSAAEMRLAAGDGYLPSEAYEGDAYIHVRGNSTATLPKRPLKLKLEEKSNLLGLGKTKHWVLLANAIDSTLLRNKLVYDFSGAIGAETWMNSENVSLIYNGEYQGVYQLCEQVRIGANSVDIYDWEAIAKEAAERIAQDMVYQGKVSPEEAPILQAFLEQDMNTDFSWMETHVFQSPSLELLNETEGFAFPAEYDLGEYINFEELPDASGGVLLEMDFMHSSEAALKTNYAMPFYFNKPLYGDTYTALYDDTMEALQALEYAFHDTDFTYRETSAHYRMTDWGWVDYANGFQRRGVEYETVPFSAEQYDGCHYSELIDMDSLLVNFLVCELTVNWDSMKNSVYLYRDLDGPFYIAPVWDYDWAWGNSNYTLNTWMPEIWQTTSEYFANEEYYQTVQWNRYLIRDPYFLALAYEKYWEIRDTRIEELICDGGLIDQYAEELKPAADANDAKWGGSMGNYEGQKFDEGIEMMKLFLEQRTAWLDRQFASVETLRQSLGYYKTSDAVLIEEPVSSGEDGTLLLTAHTELSDCKALSFQVNGTHIYTAEICGGSASIQIPDSDLRAGEGAINTVQVRALDENGAYILNPDGTTYGEYDNAVSNYRCFRIEVSAE